MTKSEYQCEMHLRARDEEEARAIREQDFEQYLEYYEKHMRKLYEEE